MPKREKIALKVIIYAFFIFIDAYLIGDMLRVHSERGFELFAIDSPALFPFFIAAIMTLVIVIALISDIKGLKRDMAEKTEESAPAGDDGKKGVKDAFLAVIEKYNIVKVALATVGLIAYVFLMKEFGFIIMTSVMIFIYTFLLYKQPKLPKKILICLISSVAMTLVLYFVFSKIFGVLLP